MLLTKRTLPLLVLFSLVLSSCEFKCSVGGSSGPSENDDKKSAKIDNGTALYNGITLNSSGNVHVKRAYLTDEKGERIAEGNYVEPISKTYINIVLDSGWSVENGKSFLGASQKVVTDGGTVILDEADMFSSMDAEGVDPEKAKTLNLSLTLNPKGNVPPTGLTVNFRVWDKKGSGEITGQYKLNTK